MTVLREWFAYRWRMFHTITVQGDVECEYRGCGRPVVGYSAYCRQHTDELIRWPSEGGW